MRMRLALLAAILSAAPFPGRAEEAQASVADPPPVEELDEVVITAMRLGDRILALENSFYQRYNELNKDDEFDMFCTQIPVRRGELETTRACLPQFYVDALSDSLTWQYRCQSTPSCYTPPDPTFVLVARNAELRSHMQGVINSDPRLTEMNEIRSELEVRLRAMAAARAQQRGESVQESLNSGRSAETSGQSPR